MNETVNLDVIMGYIRIMQTHKFEDGITYLGAYSITYDRYGNEVSRSENQWNVKVFYE